MDFHSLSRKELQTLCKKNKIPANITNVAMADALAALPHVEGLDEFLNPREGDIGTPDIHHRTASRTATQRKAVKDANVPETPAMLPSSRRKVPAVSTRRKKEVEMVEDEDADKNSGVQGKPTDVPKTPAAVASRSRATGRSVCNKNETPGGTSVQRTYNTRRSVRLLEKSLSKMSLIDTEDMGLSKIDDVSEDLSSASQHVEESSVIEKGASSQTVSTVVSEYTDESEVSSLNKADYECQSHDSGSEVKLVSGIENDAEDGLQAEPQEEGSEKVNDVEAEKRDSDLKLQGSFETFDKSTEAGSELLPELVESCDSAKLENKEFVGTKPDPLSVDASVEASKDVADQDVAALTAVVPDDACMDGPNHDVAGLLCVSPVNDASVSLKELVECNIDNQGSNEGDDDSNCIQNFEPINDVDEQAADKKVLELGSTIFSSSLEHQEVLEPKPENMEESRVEIEKVEYTADVTGASSAILAQKDESSGKSDAVSEVGTESFADEVESMEVENVILQLSLLDVGVRKAEDQKETSEKLKAEAQAEEAEEIANCEDTEFDAANAFSPVLDGTCGMQVSVETVGSFMDSSSSDGLKSNTLVDGDTDVIAEDIAIPKQETRDIAMESVVSEQQIKGESLCSAKSETMEIASEIQTVPKMISVEDGTRNAHNMLKENLTTAEEFHNMSLRGLKKMLKKFDGKPNNTTNNNDVVHMQEVERKRTALQALSQNQMTTGEAQSMMSE